MPPRATAEYDSDSGKACFDDIYDREDPRAYYQTLGALDYQVPHHAQQVARTLIARRRTERPDTIVDLCCSYGVNTALMTHDLSLDNLYQHYQAADRSDATLPELLARDREYYGARRLETPPRTVGIDVSAPAIAYALRAGLLDAGFAENLESDEPSDDLRSAVSPATLITVSGGVGYITRRTFERVLDAVNEPPWVIALVLREVSYEPIVDALASFGLVTEKLTPQTFPQRRFADRDEAEAALRRISDLGLSASGKEDTGYYHAELFVSRPAAEADVPLSELLR